MRAALLTLLFASQVFAGDLDTRLASELDRLDVALRNLDSPSVSKDVKPIIEGNRVLLTRARAATSPLVRLYRMRDAYVGIETLRYVVEHKSAESDLARVKALANGRRAAIEKPLAPMKGPALQLALRQIVANRGEKLFRAGVPYGKYAGAASALFYLGEAEGNRKFRDFVEKLPMGESSELRPNVAALQQALTKLETSAIAVYQDDPRGRSTATLSSRIKEARELANRGWLEGAALTMVEAEKDVKQESGALKRAATHDSIVAMLEADGQPALVDYYASLFERVSDQKKIPKNVTVTLVRWPYT